MKDRITYQKIRSVVGDELELSERYYKVLFTLNGIKITEREVQLLSYISIFGSISYGNVKMDFCSRYGSTFATVNNMVSKLKRLGILEKEGGKIRIRSDIDLDFSNDLCLLIDLSHE